MESLCSPRARGPPEGSRGWCPLEESGSLARGRGLEASTVVVLSPRLYQSWFAFECNVEIHNWMDMNDVMRFFLLPRGRILDVSPRMYVLRKRKTCFVHDARE